MKNLQVNVICDRQLLGKICTIRHLENSEQWSECGECLTNIPGAYDTKSCKTTEYCTGGRCDALDEKKQGHELIWQHWGIRAHNPGSHGIRELHSGTDGAALDRVCAAVEL